MGFDFASNQSCQAALAKKPIRPAHDTALKRTDDLISVLGQRGAAMWNFINLLYREYCLARLNEMRRFEVSH